MTRHTIERDGFQWRLIGTLFYNDADLKTLENLRTRYPEYYIIRLTNIYSEELLTKFGVYIRV